MKQSMSEHKKQIAGIADYLQRFGSWLETLKCNYGQTTKWVAIKRAQYTKEKKEFTFYQRQYESAVKAKKKGFDRSRYLC